MFNTNNLKNSTSASCITWSASSNADLCWARCSCSWQHVHGWRMCPAMSMNCQQLRSAFTLACCWVSISFGAGRASNVWLKICSCSTRCSWSSHWQGPMKNVRGLWTHRSSKAFAQCSSLSLQDWPKANNVNIQCLCYMFTEASHIITWTNHTSCTTTELLKPTALVWCPQASS